MAKQPHLNEGVAGVRVRRITWAWVQIWDLFKFGFHLQNIGIFLSIASVSSSSMHGGFGIFDFLAGEKGGRDHQVNNTANFLKWNRRKPSSGDWDLRWLQILFQFQPFEFFFLCAMLQNIKTLRICTSGTLSTPPLITLQSVTIRQLEFLAFCNCKTFENLQGLHFP